MTRDTEQTFEPYSDDELKGSLDRTIKLRDGIKDAQSYGEVPDYIYMLLEDVPRLTATVERLRDERDAFRDALRDLIRAADNTDWDYRWATGDRETAQLINRVYDLLGDDSE